jgi:hypothetical protein
MGTSKTKAYPSTMVVLKHGYDENKVSYEEATQKIKTITIKKDPNRAHSPWIRMEKKSSPLHYLAQTSTF